MVEEVLRRGDSAMTQLMQIWVELVGGELSPELVSATHESEGLAE